MDTLLEEEPTINKTTVCTYPEPWYPASHTTHKAIDKSVPATRPLEDYAGVYSHVAYGNLVVSINVTVNQLQVKIRVDEGFYSLVRACVRVQACLSMEEIIPTIPAISTITGLCVFI